MWTLLWCILLRKGKSSKRPRRKTRWCAKSLDDFIDIIVSSNEFKTKLIFTNTKNQRNGPIYAKIMDELKERASARGDKFTMTVNQMRTKVKKCVSQCKQAALTQKRATGIQRYQEDRGLGNIGYNMKLQQEGQQLLGCKRHVRDA